MRKNYTRSQRGMEKRRKGKKGTWGAKLKKLWGLLNRLVSFPKGLLKTHKGGREELPHHLCHGGKEKTFTMKER